MSQQYPFNLQSPQYTPAQFQQQYQQVQGIYGNPQFAQQPMRHPIHHAPQGIPYPQVASLPHVLKEPDAHDYGYYADHQHEAQQIAQLQHYDPNVQHSHLNGNQYHVGPSPMSIDAGARPLGLSAPPVAKTPARRGRTATGRGRGGSEKRSAYKGTPGRTTFSKKPDEFEEMGSDDDYNMDGMKTKSGRKVHKPSQFNPAAKTPSRRRGPGKRVIDTHFCKICERGHSPKSNLIVFCDGCNTPYHQLCHVPPIDNLLITLPDAEWFCATCDERRSHRPLQTGATGAGLTEEQKKTYLASLPISHLVQLILFANEKNPGIELFAPDTEAILSDIHKKQEQAILEEHQRSLQPIAVEELDEEKDEGSGDEYIEEQSNLPPLEDMILRAIASINAPHGCSPREIYDWIEGNYPVNSTKFRVSASQQLQKSMRSGKLDRDGSNYILNPNFVEETAKPNKSTHTAGVFTSTQASQAPNPIVEEPVYQPGIGIKLPDESNDEGFLMDDDDAVFSHKVGNETVAPDQGL